MTNASMLASHIRDERCRFCWAAPSGDCGRHDLVVLTDPAPVTTPREDDRCACGARLSDTRIKVSGFGPVEDYACRACGASVAKG